jgi:hypothetical protein
MASIFGLLIVGAAVQLLLTSARPAPKSWQIPLRNQLYDNDLPETPFLAPVSTDFLPIPGEPPLPTRPKPSVLKPVAYTLAWCFLIYFFLQKGGTLGEAVSAYFR